MLFRIFTCCALGLVLGLVSIHNTEAQLLQDRNKLKTEYKKPDGRGFGPFRQKVRNKSATGKSKTERARTPRTSQSVAGSSGLVIISPKFSKKPRPRVVIVTPRFTRKKDAQADERFVAPRFTPPRETPKVIDIRPRFSEDPYRDYRVRTPKSKSGQGMVFEFPRVKQYIDRPKNRGEDLWVPGFYKATRAKGRLHPSSNYIYAKNKDIKLIRQGMRKFNILWTRVNGNKSNPKTVDKKESKSKYDKDETEIWNNKEREYIKN